MSVILLLPIVLIVIGLILLFIGLDIKENLECARIGSIIVTICALIDIANYAPKESTDIKNAIKKALNSIQKEFDEL